MGYEIVKIINEQDDELGWAIRKVNYMPEGILTSVHIYESYFAVKEEVAELNKRTYLSNFWPEPKDPEVKALIDDPDFYSTDHLEEHDSFQRLYEVCSLVAHRRAGL